MRSLCRLSHASLALLTSTILAFPFVCRAQTGSAQPSSDGAQCGAAVTQAQFDIAYQRAALLYSQQCGQADYCNEPHVVAAYALASCLFNTLTGPQNASDAYLRATLDERAHKFAEATASYSQCVSNPGGKVADVRECLKHLSMLVCTLPEHAAACTPSPTTSGTNNGTEYTEQRGHVESVLQADAVTRYLNLTVRNPRTGVGTAPRTVATPPVASIDGIRAAMTEAEISKVRAAAESVNLGVGK